MSKALKQVEKDRQLFSILEAQLKRQDEQGRTIHTMFESIRSMYSEFTQGLEEMKDMVQEVRDSVTLNNAECTLLHSAVASKSISLAKDRYQEEEGEFKKIVGVYRRLIWKQLKAQYNVPKYNCIRRVDFDDSIQFVTNFKPENYI
jgi:ORF6C domain.